MTHLSGYFGVLILCAVFMLFINGEIGRALAYCVGFAVVVSIIMIIFSHKRFTIKIGDMSGVYECGGLVEFEVTMSKKGFCLLPYMEVVVDVGGGQSVRLRTALLFRKSVTVRGSFRPSHSGLNKLKIENVLLGDFMGGVRSAAKVDFDGKVAVLPKIVEYDGPEVFPNMLPSEEEESEESNTVMNGGLPGYEHRDYMEGDSPRRVNYKLSAKRRRLMVRLDESNGYATTNLYICSNATPDCADKAFALANRIILRGGTVKITHKGDSRTAATPETLDRMREWMAFREYADPDAEFFPDTPPADSMVVFSGKGEVTVVTPAA